MGHAAIPAPKVDRPGRGRRRITTSMLWRRRRGHEPAGQLAGGATADHACWVSRRDWLTDKRRVVATEAISNHVEMGLSRGATSGTSVRRDDRTLGMVPAGRATTTVGGKRLKREIRARTAQQEAAARRAVGMSARRGRYCAAAHMLDRPSNREKSPILGPAALSDGDARKDGMTCQSDGETRLRRGGPTANVQGRKADGRTLPASWDLASVIQRAAGDRLRRPSRREDRMPSSSLRS